MGNSKSKKAMKEPDKFFEREKWREQKREEMRKKNGNPLNKRVGLREPPVPPVATPAPTRLAPAPSSASVRSYDHDALERMRFQLHNDSDAFLLNNILLSVQFFENFERELHNIKDHPISRREHAIDEAMVRHHKHIFFADKLQECVHEHVRYVRNRGVIEPLATPRLYVIYDNVEASEPGDTSDYSAVLDAPFYKLRVEDCKEPGYVKLQKLEVLESTAKKESEVLSDNDIISEYSVYADSEKESNDSDDTYADKGDVLLNKIKSRLNNSRNIEQIAKSVTLNPIKVDISGRRRSGPIRQISTQAEKNNISNLNRLRHLNETLVEDNERRMTKDLQFENALEEIDNHHRKSILKNNSSRRASGTSKEIKIKTQFQNPLARGTLDASLSEDTETSGYRSTSSSKQNESSETESDYGYSTITESTTPKRVELSLQSNFSASSGVLPNECWSPVNVRALGNWSDDEDDEPIDTASKESLSRSLYDTIHYLNSASFMTNFVDNFMIKLGSGLGLTQDAISNAMTQGASIYCEPLKNDLKSGCEVIPALIAAWPNAANQWIIRERRIIQNPRTNFSYQWPTKYMVSKAIGFGCLLVPLGYRPKRGINPDHQLQWRITFPAAERYLESCLAHSHIRCYLFALTLHKTFMEIEASKVGLDASHIKNHLFWQCEDNYAKWPEDRLGETLRLFLKSFYSHFGHAKFPNFFMENCNDFKSIPKPLLHKLQRKLADIIESPVMHMLYAIEKLNYTKKDFFPPLNTQRLYQILTCKNPLRIINPNIQPVIVMNSSDSDEEEVHGSFWERAKAQDKHYQWKRERQRQMQEKRKAYFHAKKQKSSGKQSVEINKNIILPKRLDMERRRLVLEFFIPHFISMARSSEKFEAIKQAMIYLEQAQRLCVLLQEEPAGESAANDYFDVIHDKLSDCQKKLVDQSGYKITRRTESHKEKVHLNRIRKQRPRYENIVNQDSPIENRGIQAFTFVDVHVESNNNALKNTINLAHINDTESEEESKL